jgi:hypothetical protein
VVELSVQLNRARDRVGEHLVERVNGEGGPCEFLTSARKPVGEECRNEMLGGASEIGLCMRDGDEDQEEAESEDIFVFCDPGSGPLHGQRATFSTSLYTVAR